MLVTVRGKDRQRELNSVMEIDHVVRVHEDGTVSDDFTGIYAPELLAINVDGSHTADTDPDLMEQAASAGWTLEKGWTQQYSYDGPCMHPSESIGGGLARHIMETPGYWVATVVMEDDDSEPQHWAVAFRPA